MHERKEWIDIQYRIHFLAPFHLGTGVANGLIDHGIARQQSASSEEDGLLYVPASTLKGVIRDECEQVAELAGFPRRDPHQLGTNNPRMTQHPVDIVFGTPRHPASISFNDGRLAHEQRALLADARARAAPPIGWQSIQRTRVAVSHLRGTALTGRLFNMELGLPGMKFDAIIRGQIQDVPIPGAEDVATCSTLLLVAGMLMVDRIGGQKSAGGGRCEIEISSLHINQKAVSPNALLEHLETLGALAAERGMGA